MKKILIILGIISLISISCDYQTNTKKKDCCEQLSQRVIQLQDKVNIYLNRFNSLHSLTSTFGRSILEKDFPDCQFRQMIDEPLKFRVIACPQLIKKFQLTYPNSKITDIFIVVRKKREAVYENDIWEWKIREVRFAK